MFVNLQSVETQGLSRRGWFICNGLSRKEEALLGVRPSTKENIKTHWGLCTNTGTMHPKAGALL